MSCLNQIDNDARQFLISSLYNDQYFFWIGSGFSRNFGYPGWGEVISKIKDNLGYSGPFDGNYLKLAEILQCHGSAAGMSEADFNAEVMKALEELRTSPPSPSWKDKFIAFAPAMIVTTNWDNVLETLFDNVPNVVVRKDSELRISKKNRNIYKIHGDAGRPESVVLTQSQYNNFQREDTYLNRKIYTLFAEETAIFIGYSLSDPNIFYIYDEVVTGNVKAVSPSFMLVPTDTSDEVLLENRLFFSRKNVHIIRCSIEDFIDDCRKALKDLEGTIEKFKNDHRPILAWVQDMIGSIATYNTDEAVKRFTSAMNAHKVMRAVLDILARPSIYKEMGGELLSPSGTLPALEAHKLQQIVIKLANRYRYPDVGFANEFYDVVLSYCESTPIRWDFNQGSWPFIDLLSINLSKSNPRFEKCASMIKQTLDWSAPAYTRGYCWATWNDYIKRLGWLNEDMISELVRLAKASLLPSGKATPDTQRWLLELMNAPKISADALSEISSMVVKRE